MSRTASSANPEPSDCLVLVAAVDLNEGAEHLLTVARDLARSAPHAEIHVVHVVRPEPLSQRLSEPVGSQGIVERAQTESADWQLRRLCDDVIRSSGTPAFVHTPVGQPARQVVRVAQSVGADVVLVEAHDHGGLRRVFHRSVLARIALTAPCSVLTVRPKRAAASVRATAAA
jgi:nucleotide-binding universal stress UspA family protein